MQTITRRPLQPTGNENIQFNIDNLIKKATHRSSTPNPIKKKDSLDMIGKKNELDCQKKQTPKAVKLNKNEDRIKVYLRMRPLLQNETPIEYEVSENTISINPPNNNANSKFCMNKSFSFREIFDSNSNQTDVFNTVALPLLPDFLNGHDVLIFCYGSTNAGKTFTISGNKGNPGLLERSLDYIVTSLESNLGNHSQQLYASFFEIYNERIYDLLDINRNFSVASLKLGINRFGETEVKGITELPVASLKDANDVVSKAENGRHKGTTELNTDSSRSHTIFQLRIKVQNRKCSNPQTYAVFSVVDLAGSERLSSMNSAIGSFKEACSINKSMLVLGKCIRKLKQQTIIHHRNSMSNNNSSITNENSDITIKNAINSPIINNSSSCNLNNSLFSNNNNSSNNPTALCQVPYRESKLTHLFKNFFEPICRPSKAAMVINISPANIQYDDTIFALQFAAEASQCAIREVEKPIQIQMADDDEEFDEFDNRLESIESRIEAKIREEMEAFLDKKENEYKERLERFNLTCSSCSSHRMSIATNGISIMNQSQSASSIALLNSSGASNLNANIFECEGTSSDILMELKQKILNLSNENASLTSSINYNVEEIQKLKEKNNQMLKKNTLMRASLSKINEKNRQIACQIKNEFGFQASSMTACLMPEFNEFTYGAVPTSSIMSKPKSKIQSITIKNDENNDTANNNNTTKKVVLFPSSS